MWKAIRQRLLATGLFAAVALIPLALAAPGLGQVNATIEVNDDRLQGTHPDGSLLLYTPDPIERGSSVSHWDTSPNPDLLMEPFLTDDLPFLGLDVTPGQMQDVFWATGASNIEVFPLDPPGSGFTDPRPFSGAPGNPATTLGEARMNLFNAVLGTWANTLGSPVDIDVLIVWLALECTPGVGAALAGATSIFVFALESPTLPPHLFQSALAESLIGEDLTGLDPDQLVGDIIVFMNSAIDDDCLGPGTGWYYGLDGNSPDNLFDQASTVLHELAHGLGFATFTDGATGAELAGFPSIFDFWTFDHTQGLYWDEMTDAERVASALNVRQVSWLGPTANAMAATTLDAGVTELVITSPAELAGTYEVGVAEFGPGIPDGGLSGEIACLVDSVSDVSILNGCTAATNPAELAGKIALIDRGDCAFTDKVANAQAAGAIGAIVVNNAGNRLFDMTGTAPGITIPSVLVGAGDGRRIRQQACGEAAAFLLDGRFQVTAYWRTATDEGQGKAVELTSESGYFFFFGETNIEITMKMLDACTLPGFESFWFFAAAMTNVEVTLTVVDTQTGVSKTYTNELETPFDPILDTRAFETCP